MKKVLNIMMALSILALVSCGTSKNATNNNMNLKGKVASVKTAESIYVDRNDIDKDTLKALRNNVSYVFEMYKDNWMEVFDKKGNVISESYYSADNKLVETYQYEYDGQYLTKSIHTNMSDTAIKYIIEYLRGKDEVVAYEIYYKNNDITGVKVNTVASGKVIKENFMSLDGNSKYFVDYKYMNGKLVEKYYNYNMVSTDEYFIITNNIRSLERYQYDGDKLVRALSGTEDYFSKKLDESKEKVYFEYERFKKDFEEALAKLDEGNEEEKEEKEEQPAAKQAQQYNSSAGMYETTYSYNDMNDIAGFTCNKHAFTVSYEYDKNNNWTKMTVNYDGKPFMVKEREVKYF